MRITELITMLEQVKNEEGDLEIYVDRGDEQAMHIELAEFGAHVEYEDEEEEDSAPIGLVANIWAKN